MKKLLAIAAILVFILASANAAYVHGKVYEWFSLDELDNVVIDVNSVPGQRYISKNGDYEFFLPRGNYSLHAEYYEDSALKYVADENVLIVEDGNYIIDLIMLPAIDDEALPEFPDADIDIGDELSAGEFNPLYFAIAFAAFIAVIAAAFIFFRKKIRNIEETAVPIRWDPEKAAHGAQQAEQLNAQYAPDKYAKEVIEALRKGGNRLTQKELRDKITSIGEAKISLIVSELEDAGIIKKIKRGRGNIIILKEGN